jgi:CspA family cold shock protein
MNGTVKWFSSEKGYGFIRDEAKEKDIYVHFSDIKMNGFKSLEPDQQVTYEVVETGRGLAAKDVVVT